MESFYDSLQPHEWRYVLDGYMGCADWTDEDQYSQDEDGEPLEVIGWSDGLEEAMAVELKAFLSDVDIAEDLHLWASMYGLGQIGHDFWLTRNHHGTGFWDRDYSGPELTAAGKRLTDAAQAYGSASLYVGDDGMVYLGG